MSLTLVVFAGFYQAARHTVQYANTLAEALRGKLVLLHVNRASLFDPYEAVPEHYRQEELARQTETAAALYRMAEELTTHPAVEVATDLLPEVAQDQATRHHPALFVLSPPYQPHENAASVATNCADLLRGYEHDNYAEGVLLAVEDTQADLVVVLARQRSYLGELFHRSVTAQLLERCPVPVLVLPVAAEAAPDAPSPRAIEAANWTAGALAGLSPAN